MSKIVYQLLILGMQQSHDTTLAQDLEDTCNICQVRDSSGSSSMPSSEDFDASNQVWIDLVDFVDIIDRGTHVDGKIGVGTARVTLDLVLNTNDCCSGRFDIGHIKDGGIATSEASTSAMRNILFVLQAGLTEMTMNLNQARQHILAAKIQDMIGLCRKTFLNAHNLAVCNVDRSLNDLVGLDNGAHNIIG